MDVAVGGESGLPGLAQRDAVLYQLGKIRRGEGDAGGRLTVALDVWRVVHMVRETVADLVKR